MNKEEERLYIKAVTAVDHHKNRATPPKITTWEVVRLSTGWSPELKEEGERDD